MCVKSAKVSTLFIPARLTSLVRVTIPRALIGAASDLVEKLINKLIVDSHRMDTTSTRRQAREKEKQLL